MAFNLDAEWTRGRDRLSASLQQQLQRGREVERASTTSRRWPASRSCIDGFDELFQRYDAILTPAAPGSAPPLGSTGDPVFCTLWSLCGMPALNLPLLHAPDNLPLGLQLVGRRGDDARLLRSARWLAARLQAADTIRTKGPTMFVKSFSAVVALVLFFGYLVPVAFKLKELSLVGVMAIGVVMMLVDLWQSLQRRDG